jgi:diguanylate cyclase (GGDEF)-like protein/PAS domain S-box-containing protein
MKATDFFTPAGQTLFHQSFPKLLRDGHIEDLEFDLISKNGGIRHVSLCATAIKDANGNFLMSRTVVYDITELKNTHEKLTCLTIEQHAMLDNELVGIVKVKNRQIIWKNKAIEHIFRYESNELNGKSIRVLYPDESSFQATGEAAYQILKANGVYRTQMKMLRKDGETIWIDSHGAQLCEDSDEYLWIMVDITAQKKQEEQITEIAYHDILTGLPNRLLVTDRLKQAIAQADRANQLLAICYLDLDGFKPVNDNYGHAAGDKLLLEIANRMHSTVRANDTVGRLGGDEFVLLLTDLENLDEYQLVLQRVIDEINMPISIDDTFEVSVGASIGVTLFPNESDDPDILLRHADQAMFQAKNSGRNRVCLYEDKD